MILIVKITNVLIEEFLINGTIHDRHFLVTKGIPKDGKLVLAKMHNHLGIVELWFEVAGNIGLIKEQKVVIKDLNTQ